MAEPLCRPNPVSPRGGWAPPPPTRSRVGEAAGVAGSGGPAVRRGQGSAVTPPPKFRLLLEASSETPPQGFFARRQTGSTRAKRPAVTWKRLRRWHQLRLWLRPRLRLRLRRHEHGLEHWLWLRLERLLENWLEH